MRRFALLLAMLPIASACSSTVAAFETSEVDLAATPISAFLGYDGDQEAMEAKYQAIERDRQDLVVTCMADLGFEYVATDPSVWDLINPADVGEPDWGTREWAERYGFGASTQMFKQSEVGPDLVGQNDALDAQYNEWVDPNEAYVESLGEQANAYFEALYGNDQGYMWDESLTDEENEAVMDHYYENVYVPSGCEHESQEAVNAEDPSSRFWVDFESELAEMYERVQADPAIIEAIADFDACLSGLGHPYTYLDDPYDDLYERVEPVTEMVSWPGQDLDESDWAEMSEEELEVLYELPPFIPEEARALLAEAQADEIALALDFDDCGARKIREISLTIQTELEAEFLEVNADRLAAYQS